MAETRVRFPDGTVCVVTAAEVRALVDRGEADRVLDREIPIERTDRNPVTSET